MKIGIIGSGHVGGTLGRRWASAGGHRVIFSSRNPDSPEMRELVGASGPNARAASVEEAATLSDVILLAAPWPNVEDAINRAGGMRGKVVLDATNPLLPNLEGLEIGTTASGAEYVQEWAPSARVVKVFNTVGFNVMANPRFGDRQALMFYCGDDAEAKQIAHQLASELGFETVDAGPLTAARLLEPFALLWISHAIKHGRDFAFQFLKRG